MAGSGPHSGVIEIAVFHPKRKPGMEKSVVPVPQRKYFTPMHIWKRAAALAALVGLLAGCSYKFTRLADVSLEGKKVDRAKIGVVAPFNFDLTPVTGNCLAAPSTDYTKVDDEFYQKLLLHLGERYPGYTWVPIDAEDPEFRKEKTFAQLSKMGLSEANSQRILFLQGNSLSYISFPKQPKNAEVMTELGRRFGVEYVLLLVRPSIYGRENRYMYTNAQGQVSQGSAIIFTTDMQIQLWDAAQGILLYDSGIWFRKSQWCFSISVINSSVKKAVKEIGAQLRDVLAALPGAPSPLAFSPR